jgi:hypothetical protein
MLSEQMLRRSPALAALGPVAAAHHEKADGSGYHRGLHGDATERGALILSATDIYVGLTTERADRPAFAQLFDTDPSASQPFEWTGFRDPGVRRRRWQQDGSIGRDSTQLAVALSDGTLAGQRVLEPIGFRREGVLRGLAFIGGRWRDGVLYAQLRGVQRSGACVRHYLEQSTAHGARRARSSAIVPARGPWPLRTPRLGCRAVRCRGR